MKGKHVCKHEKGTWNSKFMDNKPTMSSVRERQKVVTLSLVFSNKHAETADENGLQEKTTQGGGHEKKSIG